MLSSPWYLIKCRVACLLAGSFLLLSAFTALANPTGGQVVSGAATINNLAPGSLLINQSSNSAIINWQDFSIASGELTRFQVPNSASATLNRVLGGNVSTIYGTLQSNGQLYLVNPNGIIVGASGKIDTAGFVASTLNFSDSQFNAQGDLNFSGSSNASIINQGSINSSMGDVYLIATQVNNSGTITAPQGNVGLAAGSQVLLQKAGDQHLFVQAGNTAKTQATGITNTGAIRSAAAELRAAGGNAYALAINNSGNIAATGINTINGQVYLTADGGDITNSGKISAKNANGNGGTVVLNSHSVKAVTKGTTLNSGTIAATGTAAGATGGTVELLGDRVGVTGNGSVNVSGQAGGGTALVGGDSRGANLAVPDADQTYVGPDAQIIADALLTGNGGKIVLWGNETTQAYGRLSACGGALSGNGGSVETSAPTLDVQTSPDISAPNGKGGSWLLDPSNITISDTVTTTGGFSAPFTITSGNTYDLNQNDLLTALESGGGTSVTLDANTGTGTGSGSGGTGTITWTQTSTAFAPSLPSGATLTLNAVGGITFNNVTINTSSGALNLVLNNSGSSGNVTIQNSNINLNGGSLTAYGTGYVSSVNASGNPDGIDIFGSTINAQGGSISLTGTAGYVFAGGVGPGGAGGLEVGNGVLIQNNANNTLVETSGTGNITIQGEYNFNNTIYGSYSTFQRGTMGVGVSSDQGGFTTTSTLSVAQGTLSITGIISQGTLGDGTSAQLDGQLTGVSITGGTLIEATGSGGGVSITGNTSGTTIYDNPTYGGGSSEGIDISKTSGFSGTISVGANGSLTLHGTSGTIDSTHLTSFTNDGETEGIYAGGGSQITGGSGTTISITGTGGSAITNDGNSAALGASFTGYSAGVQIGSDSPAVGGNVTVGTGGGISITGTAGSVNVSNDYTADTGSYAGCSGVEISGLITANGTSTITIHGNGGTVTTGSNANATAGSLGVTIYSIESGEITNVSSGSGLIQITGVGGATASDGFGCVIGGSNGGTGAVESTSGNITIHGIGGSGYTGSDFTFGIGTSPNFGLVVVDAATIQTGGAGAIALTGHSLSSNSGGIFIVELTGALSDSSFDSSPVLPTIKATGATSGSISLNGATAADAVYVDGLVSAYDVSMNSSDIILSGATVTTTDPGIHDFSQGLELGDSFSGSVGQINITNSTITGSSMLIGFDNISNNPTSQVSINNSSIQLTLGTNNASTTNLTLYIDGTAVTAGAPGVSITNGSSITTSGGAIGSGDDQVSINGTGVVSAGSNAIGVLIDHSTLTNGSSGTPGDVEFQIQGDSDSGTVAAAPLVFGAASAYGIEITDGSTLTNYSINSFGIRGRAYADNDNQAIGLLMSSGVNGGVTVQTFNAFVKIDGSVRTEGLSGGGTIGAAYMVEGVDLANATITASGINAKKGRAIQISGDITAGQVTATDNGNSSYSGPLVDYGVNLLGTQISASGDTTPFSLPINITGESGKATSSSSQVAKSVGISILQGSNITNSGAGAILLGGLSGLDPGGSATGQNVVADGVQILGTSGSPEAITASGGGSIAIAGLGGSVGSTSNGSAMGVNLQYANVTTNSGLIVVIAAAGSQSGGTTATLTGLNLGSSTLATGTSGGTQIPGGGGVVPPLIMIYATDSSAVDSGSKSSLTFQPGSATGYALNEDATSKIVTGNLVMGNYYDLFKAYAPANSVTFASFNNWITGGAAATISAQGITFNPAGIISLTSPLNQITNLDSALVGSGGFNLYDSVSLTVDPIGGNDNLNYGEIDEPGIGPVTITMAPNQNLTLTDISPITGTASSAPVIGSVIATSGSGNTITLVTSGTGELINEGGASALSATGGATYVIYATQASQVVLDGISPTQTLNDTTYPNASSTLNTIAYASGTGPLLLSGTAFTDSGSSPASGVTIDLLYDGTVALTTTSSGLGAFSFTVPATDLTGGILLTDLNDNGNTFYKTSSPTSISGIDLWGNTLRILANTVSNTALAQVAGSLTGVGINYAVSGANLTTNPGVSMSVLSNTAYTLDGNITTTGALSTSAGSTLSTSLGSVTITANSMALGGSISSPGTVNFQSTGTITDSGSVQVGSFILQDGTWSQIVGQNGLAALPAFSATSDFELQGTTTFERFAGGSGTTGSPYQIADIYGLQGLEMNQSLINANLVNNIDATGTRTWNSGLGFMTIENPLTGTGVFNGQGYTINGLYINTPTVSYVGLFNQITTGETIENVGLTNVQITGSSWVGGLVGYNAGTVEASYATGTVSGSGYVGGLVGMNANTGTVETSYAAVVVTGSDSSATNCGGLLGNNMGGTVETSHATGAVSANSFAGGLIGANSGTVETSYATGTVTGVGSSSNNIGGLVGGSIGTISNSSSTGAVIAGSGSNDVGGLVGGTPSGTISYAYSTGQVTTGTGSSDVGGLVGGNGASISNAYSTGAVTTGTGSLDIGGFVGLNSASSINDAFSTGSVTAGAGSTNVGGFVGNNDPGNAISNAYTLGAINATGSTNVGTFAGNNTATINNSFWDTDVSGTGLLIPGVGSGDPTGVMGATGAQLESETYITANATTSPVWDFTSTWTTYDGTNTPQLIGLPEVVLSVPIIIYPPIILKPVTDALNNNPPIPQPTNDTTPTVSGGDKVVGGASGVATTQDHGTGEPLALKLRQKFGAAGALRMLEIIKQDLKDGSTVNTGTLTEKWVANTGMSKLVTVNGNAELFEGLAFPVGNGPLNYYQVPGTSPQTLNDLSEAAFGHGAPQSH